MTLIEATERPVQSGTGRVILSLSSPCHQECTFCSLKDVWKPADGDVAVLNGAVAELTAGRASGVDAYTLNGFDPLAFARVLDVMATALELGYQHAEIYSPCVLLADREFCKAVVDRLPPSARIHVPLYALDAELHEQIVGRAGTFDRVMSALDHLIELAGPQSITITTVSTRSNLAALPALFQFARERGIDCFSTMPYPATNLPNDRFVDASPHQTEVATSIVDSLAETPEWIARTTFGIAPCVVLKAANRRQLPLQSWLPAWRQRPGLNGGPGPHRTPCNRAASCVLSEACPGEFFARYVALYGDDEFQAVTLYDLLLASGAAEAPSDGSERRNLRRSA